MSQRRALVKARILSVKPIITSVSEKHIPYRPLKKIISFFHVIKLFKCPLLMGNRRLNYRPTWNEPLAGLTNVVAHAVVPGGKNNSLFIAETQIVGHTSSETKNEMRLCHYICHCEQYLNFSCVKFFLRKKVSPRQLRRSATHDHARYLAISDTVLEVEPKCPLLPFGYTVRCQIIIKISMFVIELE